MRQISRSEMPSIGFWYHKCEVLDQLLTGADEVKVLKGHACTVCFKTEQDFKNPTLRETLKHITRAQQPKVIEWHHLYLCAGMVNTVLQDSQICPDCFVDQCGVRHGRPDGVA